MLDGSLSTLGLNEVDEAKALGPVIVLQGEHQHLYLAVLLHYFVKLYLLH